MTFRELISNPDGTLVIKFGVMVYIPHSGKKGSWLVDGGSVAINSLIDHRQKFYCNLSMIEGCQEELMDTSIIGRKTIKIRDIYFIDSELYVKNASKVFKFREPGGFVNMKVPQKTYQSIFPQVKLWLK